MPTDMTTGTPADRVAVDLLDPDQVSEQDAVEVHRVIAAATAADLPGDPVPTVEEIVGRLRARRTDRRRLRWVARTDKGIVGQILVGLPDLDNPHLGLVNLTVHPEHRRHGIGSALLRTAVDTLAAEGRRTLLGEAHGGSAGEAFCRALGLRPVQTLRRSLLRLADVDWAEVEAAATAAHSGYRLEAWVGRCPDELVDRFAAAKAAMNDAPTDDMDFSDLVYNATTLRQDEEQFRSMGREYRVLAAVHQASGEVAGFTEVAVRRDPACPVCGDEPTISEYIDYVEFCSRGAHAPTP